MDFNFMCAHRKAVRFLAYLYTARLRFPDPLFALLFSLCSSHAKLDLMLFHFALNFSATQYNPNGNNVGMQKHALKALDDVLCRSDAV